jgi:hypothetical protein
MPDDDLQRLDLGRSNEAPGHLLRYDHDGCVKPPRQDIWSPEEIHYWIFHSQLWAKMGNLFRIY